MPKRRKRRGPGEGSIRLRPDGRWEARLLVGYKVEGGKRKPYYKSIYAASHEEVLRELNRLRARYGVVRRGLEGMSVADAVMAWYEARKPRLRPSTHAVYERAIQRIVERLGKLPVAKLTLDRAERFYLDLAEAGLSRGTIRMVHVILKGALRRLVRAGGLDRNPLDHIDRLPGKSGFTPKLWGMEELRRFVEGVRGHRLEALFLLALLGGFRRGELLALRWEDVRLEDHPYLGS